MIDKPRRESTHQKRQDGNNRVGCGFGRDLSPYGRSSARVWPQVPASPAYSSDSLSLDNQSRRLYRNKRDNVQSLGRLAKVAGRSRSYLHISLHDERLVRTLEAAGTRAYNSAGLSSIWNYINGRQYPTHMP